MNLRPAGYPVLRVKGLFSLQSCQWVRVGREWRTQKELGEDRQQAHVPRGTAMDEPSAGIQSITPGRSVGVASQTTCGQDVSCVGGECLCPGN